MPLQLETMKPYSDLDGILRDGYSLKYDWQYQELQTVTIATYEIGEIVLTSGQILGCDPAHHDGEMI